MAYTATQVKDQFLLMYPQFVDASTAQIEAWAAVSLTRVPVNALPTALQLPALAIKTGELLSQSVAASVDGMSLKREKTRQAESEFFEAIDSINFKAIYADLVRPYALRVFTSGSNRCY